MSLRTDAADCAEEAARLLPWYVVRRLSAFDMDCVARHLERCAICRDELTRQKTLRALLTADDSVEYAPQAGLRKVLARLDRSDRDDPAQADDAGRPDAEKSELSAHDQTDSRDLPPSLLTTVEPAALRAARRAPLAMTMRSAPLRWVTAAVVIEALALGWLGLSRPRDQPQPVTGYVTLSSERQAAAGSPIRAVFAATMTLADLQSFLHANHAIVVGGPSESGVFTLMSSAGSRAKSAALLATLRSDSRVLFAEPAVSDSWPPQ